MRHRFPAAVLGLILSACASAPPKPPAPPTISVDQKMSWILQLEDQRILRVPPPPAPPEPPPAAKKNKRTLPVQAVPVILPDLSRLLTDSDPRIRRRAAIAAGRVGLPEASGLLQASLTDQDPDVRQAAAFALGILGDKTAVAALTTLLQDQSPAVRGRAAQALGLIGDASAAPAIGKMVAAYIQQGAIASIAPDDEQWPKTPESDAVRLGLFALVPLKAWDALAAAVLDSSGHPVSAWWPVAYALQRINDPHALPALQQLAAGQGRYTRAFAARGLGALKDRSSVPILTRLLDQAKGDVALAVSATRALAQIGDPAGIAPIAALLTAGKVDPNIKLEAVSALGALKAHEALPVIQDLLTDDWPTMRAAALHAAAAIDPDAFLVLLSGLDPDPNWIVRAALVDVLSTMPGPATTERIASMLQDQDKRVVPSVLSALVKLNAPNVDQILLAQLTSGDFALRAAAERELGQRKPAGAAAALRDAYTAGAGDAAYDARVEALRALSQYGAAEATETLTKALTDKDWPVRLIAADLLHRLDPATDGAQAIRPAPGSPIAPYTSDQLLKPAYSPHVFIETAKGTIEIELASLDAPQTSANFVALARKGFFNGLQIHRVVPNFVIQDGDPRGDGNGGPGYTIRDELNDRPYLRGTVGMALAGPDTGGSQFFITHSPQPHLDAKYTVFGRVVNGMDVVERIQQLDVIQRVRIWDGTSWQ